MPLVLDEGIDDAAEGQKGLVDLSRFASAPDKPQMDEIRAVSLTVAGRE